MYQSDNDPSSPSVLHVYLSSNRYIPLSNFREKPMIRIIKGSAKDSFWDGIQGTTLPDSQSAV